MNRTGYNNLSVEVYSSGTTLLDVPDLSLKRAGRIHFRKQYPGGLYADGSLYVPRPVLDEWLIEGAQRVVFRNGHDLAYDGWISSQRYFIGETEQGITLPLAGATDHILINNAWRKWWADADVTERHWTYDLAASAAMKCTLDRSNRLRFVPKNEQWTAAQYAQAYHKQPVGETTKRVAGSVQLQEGAQAWKIELFRSTDGSAWTLDTTLRNTTGTSTFDVTLGAATRWIAVRFTNDSGGNQTPTADGSFFAEVYNLRVYSETGNIYADEIFKDVRAKFSTLLNADVSQIVAAGTPLSLVPYIADGISLADILDDVLRYGDGVTPPNRYAWGLLDSERSDNPDGKPMLFLEAYPSLTDYEYVFDLRHGNVVADVTPYRDYEAVRNWIAVRWLDENNIEQVITPDDDASLKDDSSIARYGHREVEGGLRLGQATQALALAFGQRYLAQWKKAPWRTESPFAVRGFLVDKNGLEVPTSLVDAGDRIKAVGWPEDEEGQDIIMIMSMVEYEDETENLTISPGAPLGPFQAAALAIPELALASELPDYSGSGGSSGGGGDGGGGGTVPVPGHESLNFYRRKPIQAWAKRRGIKLTGPGQFGWRRRHQIEIEARHERG